MNFGQSSFRLKGKNAVVVTDPYDEKTAKYPRDVEADIVTVSHDHADHNAVAKVSGSPFVVNGPGEYEVKGVSVIGIPVWHDDKKGAERGANTVYVIEMEGLRICHLGDLGHKLEQGSLDEIGSVDIVMIPVGGKYTIDAKVACEVAKQIDPWIVIPMHYGGELAEVSEFVKEYGKGTVEPVQKLTITAEKLPGEQMLVVFDKKG